MRTVDLTQGKVALVDDEDFALVAGVKWYANKNKRTWYARRFAYFGDGKQGRTIVKMHRLIIGAKPGDIVDHINGDGLDNRRSNLRICDSSQNACNRLRRPNVSGPYRGVWMAHGRWVARIRVHGKAIWLGAFDSALEAALTYDVTASSLHGEFARLNFSEKIRTA